MEELLRVVFGFSFILHLSKIFFFYKKRETGRKIPTYRDFNIYILNSMIVYRVECEQNSFHSELKSLIQADYNMFLIHKTQSLHGHRKIKFITFKYGRIQLIYSFARK